MATTSVYNKSNLKSDGARWDLCAPPANGQPCICTVEAAAGAAAAREDVHSALRRRLRMERDWAQVTSGQAVCICLQERDDRWREASERFHQYGLCRVIRFYRPNKPTQEELNRLGVQSGGAYGCWTSHTHVAKMLLDSPFPRAAVFEDDVDFLPAGGSNDPAIVKIPRRRDLKRFMRSLNAAARAAQHGLPNGWQMWYLGHMPLPLVSYPVWLQPALFRTRSAFMHAYVLSRSGMEKLSRVEFCATSKRRGEECGIDEWVMHRMRQYASFPQFCVQCPSTSSNFLKRGNTVTQELANKLVPASIEFHRRHTLMVEIVCYFIVPILITILVILAILWLVKSPYFVAALIA
jgi:hypothetical protein